MNDMDDDGMQAWAYQLEIEHQYYEDIFLNEIKLEEKEDDSI